MIKKEMEAGEIERRVHDLANAMNKIRTAQADRDDVVVEMKHTKVSRLELLRDDLQSVQDDIPYDVEMFDFALKKGDTPRLWIDMTSFVRMGADGREYEFVKDTRMGRVILGRGSSRKKMGEHITDYVAERMLERERMIEGDWLSLTHMMDARNADRKSDGHAKIASPKHDGETALKSSSEKPNAELHTIQSVVNKPQHSTLSLFVWFLTGLVAGAGILFVLAWTGMMEQIVQWVQ